MRGEHPNEFLFAYGSPQSSSQPSRPSFSSCSGICVEKRQQKSHHHHRFFGGRKEPATARARKSTTRITYERTLAAACLLRSISVVLVEWIDRNSTARSKKQYRQGKIRYILPLIFFSSYTSNQQTKNRNLYRNKYSESSNNQNDQRIDQ